MSWYRSKAFHLPWCFYKAKSKNWQHWNWWIFFSKYIKNFKSIRLKNKNFVFINLKNLKLSYELLLLPVFKKITFNQYGRYSFRMYLYYKMTDMAQRVHYVSKRVIIYQNHWAIWTEFKWCLYIFRLIPDVVSRGLQS